MYVYIFLKSYLFWSWQLGLRDIIILSSSCPHVKVSLSNTGPPVVPDEHTMPYMVAVCVCEWMRDFGKDFVQLRLRSVIYTQPI